jgi:lipoprotein-anchoring transpeptidase ErfK/SrfK
MKFITAFIIAFIAVLPTIFAFSAETQPPNQPNTVDAVTSETTSTYYVEISISRNLLTLYEKKNDSEKTPVAEYTVGTAVRGLKTVPLGLGRVTGIYFNPWWYPTRYSRQVFRERGIELPSAVPPGHPLNYMGPFKIALSHRTNKGAIYRIHGNNNPHRVGHRVTGGCFVMGNTDGLELARRIRVGTEVNILP